MKRVTNGFNKLNFAEYSQQLWVIIDCMTGNTAYPNQQSFVQEITTKAALYDTLANKAENGDKKTKADRDELRAEITNMLHELGADVTAVAKSNVAKLISSGFSFTQNRVPTPDLTQPDIKVFPGINKGEIICKTSSQPGLKSVNFYITSDEGIASSVSTTGWTVFSFNRIKFTFTGLTSGQRYYIRVGLVGVRGQEVFSETISYIAQ